MNCRKFLISRSHIDFTSFLGSSLGPFQILVAMRQGNGTEVTNSIFRDLLPSMSFSMSSSSYIWWSIWRPYWVILEWFYSSMTSNTHAPFLTFGICWYLLHICYHSQDAPKLPSSREIHLIWRFHNAILDLCNICNLWLLPSGCYGSGPLCCHLWASSLPCNHVPKSLYPDGSWFIFHRIN
jgi:hypothetical protein